MLRCLQHYWVFIIYSPLFLCIELLSLFNKHFQTYTSVLDKRLIIETSPALFTFFPLIPFFNLISYNLFPWMFSNFQLAWFSNLNFIGVGDRLGYSFLLSIAICKACQAFSIGLHSQPLSIVSSKWILPFKHLVWVNIQAIVRLWGLTIIFLNRFGIVWFWMIILFSIFGSPSIALFSELSG